MSNKKPTKEEIMQMPWQERERYKTISDLSVSQRDMLRGNRQPHFTDDQIDKMDYLEATAIIAKKTEKYRASLTAKPSHKQILRVCEIEELNYDTVKTFSAAKCSRIIYQADGPSEDLRSPEEKAQANS